MLAPACTFDLRPGDGDRQVGTTAAEPEPITAVAGRLFYPERVALPSGAVLELQVERFHADGRRTLANFRRSLDGDQVPLPVALSFERSAEAGALDELRGRIRHEGALIRDTGPVLLDPGSDRIDLGRVQLHPVDSGDLGVSWQCGERVLRFVSQGAGASLLAGDRRIELEQVPAASGVRYEAPGDAAVWVHEKGGDFLFSLDGEALRDCRPLADAVLPLEARGNEPGWLLRLGSNSAALDYDYGEASMTLPLIDTESRGRHLHFRAAGGRQALVAVLTAEICNDDATGMPHPWRVGVQVPGRRFDGCGGRPRDLLTGAEWVVERLGEAALDRLGHEITLQFDPDGRLGGRSACNRFTAGYRLSGEGLSIERPAATKMACPDAVMALERRFFDLLAGTRRFEIGAGGELVLVAGDERLVARRAAPD